MHSVVILLIGLFLISGTMSNMAHAQRGGVLYLLYYMTLKEPDRADVGIANMERSGLFTDEFFSCLATVTQRYQQAAQNHHDFCNEVYAIDSVARSNCFQTNEAAKTYDWLSEIDPVVRGQVRWSDTNIAQRSIWGKNQLGPLYNQFFRQYIPPQESMFICR